MVMDFALFNYSIPLFYGDPDSIVILVAFYLYFIQDQLRVFMHCDGWDHVFIVIDNKTVSLDNGLTSKKGGFPRE